MIKPEKTQIALEAEAARRAAGPAYSLEKTVGEVFGPHEDWVLELGPYKLMLIPFTGQWWCFDPVHEEWADTGYRSGEVTFSVDQGELLPPPPVRGTEKPGQNKKMLPVPAGLQCLRCGAEILADRQFCTACGFPVPSPYREQPAGPQPVCTSCGHPLTQGKGFCGNCGTKVRE